MGQEANKFIPEGLFDDLDDENPSPPGEVVVTEGVRGKGSRVVSAESSDDGGEIPSVGDEDDQNH